jgi:ParB-like chromosome segregation protein Spo0J
MFIETAEQYLTYRDTVKDVFVKGKRGAEIRVPCANTIIVNRDLIKANTYNPNGMPDHKKQDLMESIQMSGFSFPVAAWWDNDQGLFVIVDGFHRWLVSGYDGLGMSHVPVAPLDHLTPSERMMATWLFNKARGFHQVDLDAELIRSLIEQGVDEDEIAKTLGVDLETVHRYKQVTGIADLFKNTNYSMPWEMKEVD